MTLDSNNEEYICSAIILEFAVKSNLIFVCEAHMCNVDVVWTMHTYLVISLG